MIKKPSWFISILLATLMVVIALPLSLFLWLAMADQRPGVESLPVPAGNPTITIAAIPDTPTDRQRRAIRLQDEAVGPVGFVIDQPLRMRPDADLPVMILLGGTPKGEQALAYMPPVGNNAIVSLDWPMPVPDDLPRDLQLVLDAPSLRVDILRAPGQVAAVYDWLHAQDWVDQDRISIIGVSLGAMIAPAAQFLIEQHSPSQTPIAATLLAFGGADLKPIIAENPSLQNTSWARERPWLLGWLAWAGAKALHPMEPANYLHDLTGQFMVVNASRDGVIPQASVDRFTALVPTPKDTATIAGGHIGPDPETPRILRTLTGIATGWLIGLDVVNEPNSGS